MTGKRAAAPCRALYGSVFFAMAAIQEAQDLPPSEPEGPPGLRGAYYESSFLPDPGTTPAYVRVDPTIDFSWPGGAPTGTTIAPDSDYSERWTGYVRLEQPGAWEFITTSNDGVRLWVDGELLIDNWTQHFTVDDVGSKSFGSAGWYSVRLEHFNAGQSATIRLRFRGPAQPDEVIPASHLSVRPRTDGTPTVDAGPDQFVHPVGVATLNAAIPFLGQTILGVEWTQLSGPPATIADPDRASTSVSLSAPGLYLFRVTAFDASGAQPTDEVRVFAFESSGESVLEGRRSKWRKLTVTFAHEDVFSEQSTDNPFLDYRLWVYFFHPASGSLTAVPGYFAADGRAADTGAAAGRKWRAHFTPDRTGLWRYLASFRTGPDIALSLGQYDGLRTAFDGSSGAFQVDPTDPRAPGFLGKGRLEYDGGHHLRFAETGEHYLKLGANSPENLLGYHEFDNTFDLGGLITGLDTSVHADGLHHFEPHVADFPPGNADLAQIGGAADEFLWGEGAKGRGILGALSYLAGKGVNSVYFLTYNVDGGDGQEVWPWTSPGSKLRMDVSKLDQWGRVLDYMTHKGLAQHLVTQETENDDVLDGGTLGRTRKLYYRELVARFGHSLALTWNLGEENTNSGAQQRLFADYLRALDPYDHPITIHARPDQVTALFNGLLGFENLEGPSLQLLPENVGWRTRDFVDLSSSTGKRWVVTYDEQSPAGIGAAPDVVDFWHDSLRRALWDNLMGQGAGVEWYFGWDYEHHDVDCEDLRTRDHLWDMSRYAIDFFQEHLPFWQMKHANELTGDPFDSVLALPGTVYAVFDPSSGGTVLDLQEHTGSFSVRWFDPRLGTELQVGTVGEVEGPGLVGLGSPPWTGEAVALVERF